MKTARVFQLIIFAVLASQTVGCSSLSANKAASGDRVTLEYLCRAGDGSIAASAGIDVAADPSSRLSPLYRPANAARPAAVTIGAKPELAVAGLVTMEQEVESRLSAAAEGMDEGDSKRVEVKAETPDGMSLQDRYLKMARVRKREKELKLSREEYTNKAGKLPETGAQFVLDPLVPGKVAAVDNGMVTIRFTPASTADIATPYGRADIMDAGDHYEIVLKVSEGNLVRTGPIAGRIVAVDDRSFTIDYGNPFAGETFDCDLTLLKVESSGRASDNANQPAEPAATK